MGITKGQSWSFDIALAVVIMIGALIVFFSIASNDADRDFKQASDEADYLIKSASSTDDAMQIIEGNEVDDERLSEVAAIPYSQLKAEAGVKNDFCIYLENNQGNVIPINGSMGIGSGSINVSGIPCG